MDVYVIPVADGGNRDRPRSMDQLLPPLYDSLVIVTRQNEEQEQLVFEPPPQHVTTALSCSYFSRLSFHVSWFPSKNFDVHNLILILLFKALFVCTFLCCKWKRIKLWTNVGDWGRWTAMKYWCRVKSLMQIINWPPKVQFISFLRVIFACSKKTLLQNYG